MTFLQLLPTLLVVALALIMFGLGLSLTLADFKRVLGYPKAVLVALLLQVVVLPAACYALVVAFGLPPLFAVGLMLLAASPGGVSANLFSHLFGGNVALNISLTAINTVLSIVTLPLIANWAIAAFADTGQVVPLQFAKVAEVVAVVLLPVAAGMVVAARAPAFAARMEKPFKIFSALVLAVFVLVAIVKEWPALAGSFATLGPAVLAFNLLSLLAGYYVSRAVGLDRSFATAIGFEIGVHNSTLAIYVALSVLGSVQLALPAAIYSVSMYVTSALFGLFIARRRHEPARAAG
jgi:BASS family bile acid:Na+ symporter